MMNWEYCSFCLKFVLYVYLWLNGSYYVQLSEKHSDFTGIDVLNTSFEDSWPNAADVLFPIAICEVRQSSKSGHLEVSSLLCEIHVNRLLRWSMFVFWMWMFLIFFLGILHLIYIIFLFYKSEKKKFGDWVLQRFLQMNFYAVELNEFV